VGEVELGKIVGAGNVLTDDATLEQYAKDMSFTQPVRPAAVVKVSSLEDIQNLVKWANETETSLVPVSSKGPHFRGDTVPSTGGAVIVDLSGMKKVIHVGRKNRMVMFEAGVTYSELKAAVEAEGMRLNMPLAPRASKSVLGSILEREPVTMPVYQWDIADPTGCFEVVFGNGELFRTGAAAGSGTIEEQWAAGGSQKEAAGPSSGSIYRLLQGAQGTMGICSWGTVRTEILPNMESPWLIGSDNPEKLFSAASWLVRMRLANELFILSNVELAMLMCKDAEDFATIKASLPPFVLFYNQAAYKYFPEEKMAILEKDAEEVLKKYGLKAYKKIGDVLADNLLKVSKDVSPEPFWKLRKTGACQDIFVVTVYDSIPGILDVMTQYAEKFGFSRNDIGCYIQPMVQGVNVHVEFNLFYDPTNADEVARAKELTNAVTVPLMNAGGFFSRVYGDEASIVYERSMSTVGALKKVKDVLDPNGIMNPGKLCF
jgi:FAD/FMN-containing dehydrogenase